LDGSIEAVGTFQLKSDAFSLLRRDESGGEVRYTYTGQETEDAIASGGTGGLMNYGARMYDPQMGRFLSVDPAGQYQSPYTYAGNNPVGMVDPDGRLGFLASVALFATVNLAADRIRGKVNSPADMFRSFGLGAVKGALAAYGGGLLSAGSITSSFAGESGLSVLGDLCTAKDVGAVVQEGAPTSVSDVDTRFIRRFRIHFGIGRSF
jgi:RHS repeat-associated protein